MITGRRIYRIKIHIIYAFAIKKACEKFQAFLSSNTFTCQNQLPVNRSLSSLPIFLFLLFACML